MKKKCLALLDTLDEGEKALKRLLKTGQADDILPLLGDMQQSAIAMGTAIEQQEGEDCPTVAMLEDYCDLLYQCANSTPFEAVQIQNRLTKLHKRIRKSIQNEVRNIREVVFFPYKVSMWDALESVWKAAAENPNCRVFVVPIPYYDKNPDGSFGEMHYEGGQFPDYVPIVHWKDYSVLDRKPDIAFIHNPYDGGNYVTSVHPNFYAEELKKSVKYLAYIPYFVSGDTVLEHFCTCSGVIYADRVFVESELIAEQYRNYFQRFVKDQGLEKFFPAQMIKEKFQGSGSPKIDKAVLCRKEDYVLPKAWEDLLNGKKAILYNTGIGGILAGNEQELKKIQDVLRFFQGRNDVVLWWRPHPLSGATISSMRPQLLERYHKLVEWYQQEGFGIYDNTPDLYQAIAHTAGFYGDWSSICYLYGVQGKPVMTQRQEYLLSDSQDKTLYFIDCAYEEEKIWFQSAVGNRLYEMDLTSGDVNLLGEIPNEMEEMVFLYGRILKSNNSLWLIPLRAKEIAQYDLTKRRFVKYSLPEEMTGNMPKLQYVISVDNTLYMMTNDYRYLVILDTENEQITVEHLYVKDDLRTRHIYPLDILPVVCSNGKQLYFVIYGTNYVIEYDRKTRAVQQFRVGPSDGQYTHILFDGHYFWLIPSSSSSGRIIRWDKENREIREITEYPKCFYGINWFSSACIQGGFLWLFPIAGSMCFKIDLKALTISPVNFQEDVHISYFSKALKDGSILIDSYTAALSQHTLKLLNKNGEAYKECKMNWTEVSPLNSTQYASYTNAVFDTSREYLIMEKKEINLQSFVDFIVENSEYIPSEQIVFQQSFANSEGKAGQNIMNHMLTLFE